jgi:hypothetical protein
VLRYKTAPQGPQHGIPRAAHRRPTACIPPNDAIPAFGRHSPSNALQAYGLHTPSDAFPAFGRHSQSNASQAYGLHTRATQSPPSSGSSACSCYKFGRTSHCRVEVQDCSAGTSTRHSSSNASQAYGLHTPSHAMPAFEWHSPSNASQACISRATQSAGNASQAYGL